MDDTTMRKAALMSLLLEHLGDVKGRTRIQKLLYLADISGWKCIDDYVFYQYGPYSDWVKRFLEILVKNDAVKENKMEFGKNRTVYNYRVTQDGKSLVSYFLKKAAVENTLLQRTKSLFGEFDKFSTDDLELMSSLVYLKRENPEIRDPSLISLTKKMKPRFSRQKIRKGLQVFDLLSRYEST
jgi:uncharacterized protein YwgA